MEEDSKRCIDQYENAYWVYLKLSTIQLQLAEAVNYHYGKDKEKLKQSLLLVLEVMESNRECLDAIKERMLKGKE